MANYGKDRQLVYEHEVLWALYDIRDYYLKKIVQGVYENIGQILSLVRVQLRLLSNHGGTADLDITDPGSLVGKAMKDLRTMCRGFYPESELIGKAGLIDTLEYELELLGVKKSKDSIKVTGVPASLETGLELIVYRILQEILISLDKDNKEPQLIIEIIYDKKFVTFILKGDHFQVLKDPSSALGLERLKLSERAKLIGGKLEIRKAKDHKKVIKLKVPFKPSIYE
ncbi:MAG: hypothetical protein ACXWCG_09740 [Flavitalea sp.]